MRPRAAMPLAVPALALVSCGELPEREVGFDSPDPAGRVQALRRAATEHDRGSIPGLIGALASDDPAQRMLANRELIMLTGEDFGYDHASTEGARAAAAARWRAWWASENARDKPEDRPGYPEGRTPAAPAPIRSKPATDAAR